MSVETPRPWGAPLERLDRLWSLVEERLAVAVILAEIATLVGWVALKGLAAADTVDGSIVGTIFRASATALLLGALAHLATRPKPGAAPSKVNAVVVTSAVVVGLAAGKLWSGVGTAWSSNAVEWLQSASALALVGGPRGLVTRLTLWLALLGASLAASRGKHINIDVATRYIPPAAARPVAILGWVFAAAVCFAAAYGFTDSIAVIKFRAEAFHACERGEAPADAEGTSGLCATSAFERFGVAAEGVESDLFLLRRQLELDVRSLPAVLVGERYDAWLTNARWSEWVEQGGWTEHFPKEAVDAVKGSGADPNARKLPLVVEPGTGEGRDLLIRDMNFILPFGLLIVGLKFLLRVLRTLSGHVKVDPNAAHDDEEMKHAHDHDREVVEAEADVLEVPAGLGRPTP